LSIGENGASISEWERYGPFGAGGNEVGNYAISLLAGLRKPTLADTFLQSPQWDEGDVDTFEDLADLDTGIRFIGPAPDLDGGDIGDLHRDFKRLFAAVPFTEGERRWMYEPPTDQRRARGLDELVGRTDEIMEAGVLRVVQGRDLARRWWAWRRERDEFAGQGSLHEARDALGAIALKLVSDAHWPGQHRNVLDELHSA
jgi:hypothetical protein